MMKLDEMSADDLRDQVRLFRRLLQPVWMQLAYQALGDQPKPTPDTVLFHFMGGGGSDWTTFGDFEALMGDPWAEEAVDDPR